MVSRDFWANSTLFMMTLSPMEASFILLETCPLYSRLSPDVSRCAGAMCGGGHWSRPRHPSHCWAFKLGQEVLAARLGWLVALHRSRSWRVALTSTRRWQPVQPGDRSQSLLGHRALAFSGSILCLGRGSGPSLGWEPRWRTEHTGAPHIRDSEDRGFLAFTPAPA